VGDGLIGDSKVVGSAQRRHRGALLQHGAVLLARSRHAPDLPGIHELTGIRINRPELADAIGRAWHRETGWALSPHEWTDAERDRQEELAREKYGQRAWNDKR
jgi:lipoate-protein ligase A